MVKRVRLSFVPGLEVEFVDRDKAIQQVVDWGRRGTRLPIVVFGPEGCGKTAWLKQAAEVLKEMSYDVIYIDALHREFFAHTDVVEVSKRLSEAVADAVGYPAIKLADLVI
jgi:ABC-type cobalamin/Fe3+-siderophores transport system ATPase subunit